MELSIVIKEFMKKEIQKGDILEHTCPYTGRKERYTYTGIRREVKETLFDFFTNGKGETVFFSPFEVEVDMIKV